MITYKAKKYMKTVGSQRDYTFEFDYIDKEFVKVYLAGKPVGYTLNDHTVTLNESPQANQMLVIVRETPTKRLIGWNDSSILLARDMNLESIQLLHIAEETLDRTTDIGVYVDLADGTITADNRRIKGLADPQSNTDAISKKYLDSIEEKITKSMEAIKSKIEGTQGEIQAELREKLADLQRVKQEFEQAKSQMQNTIETTKGQLQATVESAKETIKQDTNGKLEKFQQGIYDKLNGHMATINSTFEEYRSQFEALKQRVENATAFTENYYTKTDSDNRFVNKTQHTSDIEEIILGMQNKYQPKGNYETVEGASSKYQPKGSYLTSHQDISHLLSKSDAQKTYQPKGTYISEQEYATFKSKTEGKLLDIPQQAKSYTDSKLNWTKAWTGKQTTQKYAICTLPSQWKECLLVYSHNTYDAVRGTLLVRNLGASLENCARGYLLSDQNFMEAKIQNNEVNLQNVHANIPLIEIYWR